MVGHVFFVPEIFAVFMPVSTEIWERQIERRFKTLQGIWDSWLSNAAAKIQSRLEDGEPEDDKF